MSMRNKRGALSRKLVFYGLFALIVLPIVFAGMFDAWKGIFNSITGMATSATTSVNITITGNSPVVGTIHNITIGNPSITLANKTTVTMSFTATDADGVNNLNTGNASVF